MLTLFGFTGGAASPTHTVSRLRRSCRRMARHTAAAGILLICCHPALRAQTYTPPASNRVDIDLNAGWRFHKGDLSGAQAPGFNDSAWDALSVPHTWNNFDGQDGGNNYYRGIGWYRKHYTVPSSYANRRLYLQFDGSNLVTDVYVNGTLIGEHRGGYAAFRFEATSQLKAGQDNVIAVRVNNARQADVAPLSADFTFFGGIYRSVHLLVTDNLHVRCMDYGASGVYLKQTDVSADSADLQVTAKIWNNNTTARNVTIHAVLTDADSSQIASLTDTRAIGSGQGSDVVLQTRVPTPHLWNGLSDPYLYTVYVEVREGAAVTDLVAQPLGFRAFAVDPDFGFFLNGQPLDLHGVNRHQDRIDKGWAIGRAEHEEDMSLIVELGATAVRLAHYQHDDYFYSLADRNGLVIWAELPLVNQVTASTAFDDNARQQLTELIRQNYNHPSICFWSLANELSTRPDPNPLLDQLAALARQEDPTRLSVLASCCVAENDPTTRHTDLIAYNRYYGWYYGDFNQFAGWADQTHRNNPARSIGVSEYGAGASIFFHSDSPRRMDHTEEYQNLFHEAHWKAMAGRPFLWCKFVWNMFDFASDGRNEGDTPGRNDKGLVTYDRQTRKDAFYWYKANWSSDPFVYITGRHFTSRTLSTTDVKIYSNTDWVAVSVNGVPLGGKTSPDSIFTWPGVTLTPGDNVIEAVGFLGDQMFTDTVVWTLR